MRVYDILEIRYFFSSLPPKDFGILDFPSETPQKLVRADLFGLPLGMHSRAFSIM